MTDDADHWRRKYHAMRREVRRLNKTVAMYSKIVQLAACRQHDTYIQLMQTQKALQREQEKWTHKLFG